MTKSYRTRNLSQRCQLAKSNGQGQPRLDEQGNIVIDHGGLWFLKVSGNAHHDRKRLIPEDAEAFFRYKATEIEAALKARASKLTFCPLLEFPEEIEGRWVQMTQKYGST